MSTIKTKMLSPVETSKLDFSNISWTASTIYSSGMMIEYLGSLYRCTTAHTSSSSFDDTKFELITALVPGTNVLVNSNFDFWQRGDLRSGNNNFGSDHWYNQNSVQQEKSTDVPNALSKYSNKITATDLGLYRGLVQIIESQYCREIAEDGSMTLSFWMKASQDCIDSQPYIAFNYADTEDDFTASTGIGNTFIAGQLTADTWCKVEVTRTSLDANVKNGIRMILNFQGTLEPTVAAVAYVAQFKLEAGTIATPYVVGDYDLEFAKCKRYYQIIGNKVTITNPIALAFAITTDVLRATVFLDEPMRGTPTVSKTDLGSGLLRVYGNGQTIDIETGTISIGGMDGNNIIMSIDATGLLTAYQAYMLSMKSYQFEFEAELMHV